MNWRRWINKDNETLFDLIFGLVPVREPVQEPEQLSCDDGTSGEEEHGI